MIHESILSLPSFGLGPVFTRYEVPSFRALCTGDLTGRKIGSDIYPLGLEFWTCQRLRIQGKPSICISSIYCPVILITRRWHGIHLRPTLHTLLHHKKNNMNQTRIHCRPKTTSIRKKRKTKSYHFYGRL